VKDPTTTNGNLVPDSSAYTNFGGGIEGWMTRTGLRRVDVNMMAALAPLDHFRLGPRQGEPSGVYAFERLQAGDPRCADYERTTATRAARLPAYGPLIPGPDCVGFRFLGPPEPGAYEYVIYNYGDDRALRAGYVRFVQEMRHRSGRLVAQSVTYRIHKPPVVCAAGGEYLTDLILRDPLPWAR
jgi:hypothetical protein